MCLWWCEANWTSNIFETNNQGDVQEILDENFYHKLVDEYRGNMLLYMSSYEKSTFRKIVVT